MKKNKELILDEITYSIWQDPHYFILSLFSTKNKQFKHKNNNICRRKKPNKLIFPFIFEEEIIEIDVKELMEWISKKFRNFRFSSIKDEREYSPYQIYKFYKKIVEMDEKSRAQIKSKFFEKVEDGYKIHFYYDFTLIKIDDETDEIREDIIKEDLQKTSCKEKNDNENITTLSLNVIIEYKNGYNDQDNSIKVRKLKFEDVSENKSKDERFNLSLSNLNISKLEKIFYILIDQMNQHDHKLKDIIQFENEENKYSSLFPEYKINMSEDKKLYDTNDIKLNKNTNKTIINDEADNKKQDIISCEKTSNIKTDSCSKCEDYDISLVKIDQSPKKENYRLDLEKMDNIRMFIIGNTHNERTVIIKDILNEVSDKYAIIALFTSSFDEYLSRYDKLNNQFLYYDDSKDKLSEEKKTEIFFKRIKYVMDKINNHEEIYNKSNSKVLVIFDASITLNNILDSHKYNDDNIILIRKILGGEYENIDFIFSDKRFKNHLDILLSRDNSATGIFLDKYSKIELEFHLGKKIYPDDDYSKYKYNNEEAMIIMNINGYGFTSGFALKNEIFIKRKVNP